METHNIPIEMRNLNKHRHRTNNSVEGVSAKLKSIIAEQQPKFFLQVR